MTTTKIEANAGLLAVEANGEWFCVQWKLGETWRVGLAAFRWMWQGLLTYRQARELYQLAKRLEAANA